MVEKKEGAGQWHIGFSFQIANEAMDTYKLKVCTSTHTIIYIVYDNNSQLLPNDFSSYQTLAITSVYMQCHCH